MASGRSLVPDRRHGFVSDAIGLHGPLFPCRLPRHHFGFPTKSSSKRYLSHIPISPAAPINRSVTAFREGSSKNQGNCPVPPRAGQDEMHTSSPTLKLPCSHPEYLPTLENHHADFYRYTGSQSHWDLFRKWAPGDESRPGGGRDDEEPGCCSKPPVKANVQQTVTDKAVRIQHTFLPKRHFARRLTSIIPTMLFSFHGTFGSNVDFFFQTVLKMGGDSAEKIRHHLLCGTEVMVAEGEG
ncbi:hypothetical protein C8J56DRAFT_1064401 [Mycena floridula]|nr:hypothetical protein C8J56DRAFT_1064401 [Mycena floridula]